MRKMMSPVMVLGVFLSLALGTFADATTIVILPSSQDTYVDGSSPNHIYGVGGTANRMFVQPSNGVLNPKIQRALVQFDLSGVPQFSTITSAILDINEQSGNLAAARTHGAHRATASWAQGSVKWNSQPTANASPTSTQSVGLARGYKSFTVTPDVQAFINSPVTNHGWLVRDQTETGSTNEDVGYVTREDVPGPHDDETRPKLTIDFTAPLCSTDAQCADTNPCTTNERCQAGNCAVDPVNCDDGNACTDDICDAQQGCMHPLANCDDGFSCTTDSCNPNTLGCTHTPVPAVCAHDGCQTGTCVADQNDNTLDPLTGCMVTSVAADGAACNSDGIECTSDQCLSGECTHPDVSAGTACSADGNPCTDDVCDGAGGCHVNNSAACDDNDACTQTDQCSGGQCIGSNSVVCTALDQCHVIGTCNTQTGMCSNPPAPNNTPCDDNTACTSPDQCDGSGQCVGGNPVVCTALDQCHTVGTCDPQTGICSDPALGEGSGCDDGNGCTVGDVCTGGQCIGAPATCGDSVVQPSCNEECDDPTPGANCNAQCRFICGPTPQTGCRTPTLPNKALVVLKNKSPDKKDALTWKWIKGMAVTPAELGTPLSTTGYTICVYDTSGSSQPLLLAMAPPGDTCHGKPCWKTVKGGFKYKDRDLTPDGLSFLLEKSGAAGKAKMIVRGKGADLGMPTLPLTTPVTVQVKRNDDASICWSATYTTTIKNQTDQFKAKSN